MGKSTILILLLMFSSFNLAQFSRYKTNPYSNIVLLNLSSGISQSETDFTNSNLGITGRASAEYYLPSNSNLFFGLKLEAEYSNLSGDQTEGLSKSSFNTDIITFGPSVSLTFLLNKKTFPYLTLGVKNLWYNDFTTLGLVSEFGIRFLISNYFAVNANASFNFLTKDNIDNVIINSSNNDFYAAYSIGVSYAVDLTVTDDLDGDGIKNIDDGCPEQVEDFDGYEDNDGCPEFDNDKDGIVDVKDNCVDEAEDFDGFEDNDGCPDYDNDGDGILDVDDKCPDLKEDFDGFEDDDGCPESDNDKDGILDQNDKCPNDPETFNNFEDSDGCPDELPEPEVIESPSIIKKEVNNNIPLKKKTRVSIPNEFLLQADDVFISNGAQIKSSGTRLLNDIANQMNSNPGFKWRIEGHLDNSGTKFELMKLSTARAKSILNYLVSRGLSAKSFKAVGLSDEFPLAPNSTIHGRLKNRRIVIKRIR